MATYINPLNLKKIIVNTLAGTPELFTFLSVIIISMACAYFRMPDKIYLIFLGLFAIIFQVTIGSAFYTLAVVITGLVVFKSITKIIVR